MIVLNEYVISGSADDDWERDFDVELTEEDLKAADEIAKKLNLSSTDYTKLSAEMVYIKDMLVSILF